VASLRKAAVSPGENRRYGHVCRHERWFVGRPASSSGQILRPRPDDDLFTPPPNAAKAFIQLGIIPATDNCPSFNLYNMPRARALTERSSSAFSILPFFERVRPGSRQRSRLRQRLFLEMVSALVLAAALAVMRDGREYQGLYLPEELVQAAFVYRIRIAYESVVDRSWRSPAAYGLHRSIGGSPVRSSLAPTLLLCARMAFRPLRQARMALQSGLQAATIILLIYPA